MQASLAACRDLDMDYNTLPKLLYMFLNIKRNMF